MVARQPLPHGVTESAEVSVEVLLIWQPTGVDISGRSRASSLPIGYSSLPLVAERLPQVSTLAAACWRFADPKDLCGSI